MDERLAAQQIADQLDCLIGKVYTSLKRHDIQRRNPGEFSRKYPQLRDLEIGESIDVERPKTNGKYQSRFYPMGKSLGIRISVRTMIRKPCGSLEWSRDINFDISCGL